MSDYAFMMRGCREASRVYLRKAAKESGISMGAMFDRIVILHQLVEHNTESPGAVLLKAANEAEAISSLTEGWSEHFVATREGN